jgi:hypothetical protein
MAYATELEQSVYQQNGFENREDYLDSLRDEYGAELVDVLITVLPASEDFDGLVSELSSYEDYYG